MVNIQYYHIADKNYARHVCYAFQKIQYYLLYPFYTIVVRDQYSHRYDNNFLQAHGIEVKAFY